MFAVRRVLVGRLQKDLMARSPGRASVYCWTAEVPMYRRYLCTASSPQEFQLPVVLVTKECSLKKLK